MKYKCKHCGRTFDERCAHYCNTGLRKRNQEWEIVELSATDFIHFKAMQFIVTDDLIPLFGGRTNLLDACDEINTIIRKYEIEKRGKKQQYGDNETN